MAAGTGERMNSGIPKQFMEINGLPIIVHTYKLFKEIENLNIYIVLPSLDFEKRRAAHLEKVNALDAEARYDEIKPPGIVW